MFKIWRVRQATQQAVYGVGLGQAVGFDAVLVLRLHHAFQAFSQAFLHAGGGLAGRGGQGQAQPSAFRLLQEMQHQGSQGMRLAGARPAADNAETAF